MTDKKEQIDLIYAQIIEKLKDGHRPHIEIDGELFEQITKKWQKVLDGQKGQQVGLSELNKVFFILDHARSPQRGLTPLFCQTLDEISEGPTESNETLIFTLGAAIKHIVELSQVSGNLIHYEFIEVLKKRLRNTKNPEILEWILRLIESMGRQGIKLQKEVRQAKPSILKALNPHSRAGRQIIDLLERQWSSYVP